MHIKGVCGSVAEKSNELFFEIIDSIEKAWILGFLYADGCVSGNRLSVQLAEKDLEIIQKIKNILGFQGKLYKSTSNGKPQVSLMLTSTKMTNDLRSIGCSERKTHTLKFPSLDEYLIPHFVRGYFDGDGCITYNKHRNGPKINIKSTEKFLSFLKGVLSSLGISSSLYKQNHAEVYNLDISGYNSVVRFGNMIYKDSESANRMDRKFNRFIEVFDIITKNRKMKLRNNTEVLNIN